jgi:hypothetical protein
MTPTWAVILVGLAGGVIGSAVTTLLTISHERAAEFRSHMLNAADDFSTAAIVALQQTRDVAGEITDPRTPLIEEGELNVFTAEIKARLDSANKTVDDAFAKQARVHLLFADSSPTTMASVGVTAHLRNMLMALESPPQSIRDTTVRAIYSRNFTGTQEQHVKFNQAALVALQQTWWDRLRERWDLRRRSKKNES